jgi:carbonic anhydrase/acetyltransferase-like protein (isoleucine patch superfamily)
VQVGEFAVIGEHAVIGADSRIANHAIVRAGCVLGTAVSIDSFAVLGGHPHSRAPGDLRGHVEVGDRTVVREGVTINMPTQPGGVTAVGSDCMLMANSHVGHDCVIGNSSTLANNVMLAGHVCVGDSVFLGAGIGLALVGTVTAGGSTLPAVYAWASLFAVLTYVRLCLPTQRYRSAQSLGSDTKSIGAYARAQRIPAAYAPDAIGQPWMAQNPPVATTIRAQA